jgi:hypothetical protein
LQATLDPVDPYWEAAWVTECENRIAAAERGEMPLIDASQVMMEIRAQLRKRFIPDFLIRLANGKTLVLKSKGEDSEQNRAKRSALEAWVKGVNAKGGFGVWRWDVAFKETQIYDILDKHSSVTFLA